MSEDTAFSISHSFDANQTSNQREGQPERQVLIRLTKTQWRTDAETSALKQMFVSSICSDMRNKGE